LLVPKVEGEKKVSSAGGREPGGIIGGMRKVVV